MEKVVVTLQVANAIEKAKSTFLLSAFVDFANEKSISRNNHNLILRRELEKETLLQAIFYGYEIEEPKFEVGNWVIYQYDFNQNIITRISAIEHEHGRVQLDGVNSWKAIHDIRHATKEEIFWAELGREVGEFVEGDSGLTFNGLSRNTMVTNIETLSDKYKMGELKGFYPAESFRSFPIDGDLK